MNHWQPNEASSLLLRELRPPAPEAARALLGTTGIDPAFLQRWGADGRLFVIGEVADGGEGPYAAAALVVPTGGRIAELRALAIGPRQRAAGKRLLRDVATRLCGEGIRRIVAPIPSASLEQLAVLQAAGFRPAHVERDAATPEHGYPDPLALDLLWLELTL